MHNVETNETFVLCYTNIFGEDMEQTFLDPNDDVAQDNYQWRKDAGGYSNVRWERRTITTITSSEVV